MARFLYNLTIVAQPLLSKRVFQAKQSGKNLVGSSTPKASRFLEKRSHYLSFQSRYSVRTAIRSRARKAQTVVERLWFRPLMVTH